MMFLQAMSMKQFFVGTILKSKGKMVYIMHTILNVATEIAH